MKKLSLELEHCYGIKKLGHTFDFEKQRAIAIYAPNGSMKSSLARVFQDIAEGRASSDLVFPARTCARSARDETGAEVPPELMVVIRPYEEEFEGATRSATLLVDGKLRKEYEALHEEISESKSRLVKALRTTSGSKRDIEKEVSLAFTRTDRDFFGALRRIRAELEDQKEAPFADLKYDRIFDERAVALLGTKDVKSAIESYIKKYNELLAASVYFRKGVFTYYNAATIAKNLAQNGFFEAKHTLLLNAGEKKEISTQKELEELIQTEKEALLSDLELKAKFLEVEKLIQKNEAVRDFEQYLAEHEEILPELSNLDLFREQIWKSYLKANDELFVEVVSRFEEIQKRRQEIQEEAARQGTQWEAVVEIFNSRFFVPFKLVVKNKVSVMLGQDQALALSFEFQEGVETATMERDALVRVLSTGEKKALYLLNVIFEVEVRRKLKQETLFVFDDVADSFDYKNKYAIVQYLQEIGEEDYFTQLILTHNFDFFRTLESRFVGYKQCFAVGKSPTEIVLSQAQGIRNVFVKDWRQHLHDDARKRIASVAFARNLIEFTAGEDDPRFTTLTSLLHWKPDTGSITQADLDQIYGSLFPTPGGWATPTESVLDSIRAEAQNCLGAAAGQNFENKSVLAIAARLAAEQFMVDRIAEPAFVAGIQRNQTGKLVSRFKERFPAEKSKIEVLQRVNLITPENIHLNAFMYEPIVDMSDDHLRLLYRDVSAL